MKKTKCHAFWEMNLNSHTMLPGQKVVNRNTTGVKEVTKLPRRKYYKG